MLTAFLMTEAAATAHAQSARERVLDYIGRQTAQEQPAAQTPSPVQAPIAEADAITPPAEPAQIPEIISPKPIPSTDTLNASEIITTRPSSVLTREERENSIVRDLSLLGSGAGPRGPESFGFFTSARDYIAQRGQTPAPRLTLRYDVTRKNAKTAVLGAASTVDIIIGTDYAAISKSPDEMIIYDFKENRLLNVAPIAGTFSNASLYAAAYRNIDTVSKMTEGGKKRTLTLGKGRTLDAFYLESALGYAAGPPPSKLKVSQLDDQITADFNQERVFSASLSGPNLENFRQAFSFIGLLYHSEPVHPAILAELKEFRAAPNAMTFHSYGPKMPGGEIVSWTLKSKMSETAGFPLPASAKSVLELDTVSPLAFVMNEAIANRALGGRVDPRAALTVINQQLDQGDPLSAWVSAQSLQDSQGGCEKLAGLCAAIRKAEAKKDSSPELSQLMTALSQIDAKTTRAKGLSALTAMISAPDAPSVVLRRAGLALAKVPPAARSENGLSELDPAELLTQAIARNPYDFLAYQGLARLQAARGNFIQSWDINDAMRAFAQTPSTLSAPIDRAEAKLRTRAPGFFPPVKK